MYLTLLKLFTLTLCVCFVTAVDAQQQHEQYKQCQIVNTTITNTTKCPENSYCALLKEDYKCLCLKEYQLNPQWQQTLSNLTNYCINITVTTATPTTEQITEIKNKVYIQGPAKSEHLAFGILMVLLVAIGATAILYVITVVRPIKRTKIAYMKMKRRRQNHRRLHEFDDIDMNERRNTTESNIFT